ncbi:MAG: SURF1 family protein [Nocardioides sp.]|nr:SURF1 family protein [Nocardioides sp.]
MNGSLAPRFWAVHLLAVVLVAMAGVLGFWQLGSWQDTREREAVDLSRLAPEPLSGVMGSDDPFPGNKVGQPVTAEGTWVPGGTIYVSGRQHEGEDGYWQVTPLAIGDATAPALPVVLGWVASPGVAPAAPSGPGDLVAYLQPTEGTGQVDTDPSDDVLPQLRTADVIQYVDQDLYGAYAVAREGVGGLPAADLAQLPEASTFTGLRNLLYAIEWWVFGAFAVFIWFRYVRDSLRAEEEPGETSAAGTPRVASQA